MSSRVEVCAYYDSEACRATLRFSLVPVRRAFSSCSTHAYHTPPRIVTKIPNAFARMMVRSKITTESKIVMTCFTLAESASRVSKAKSNTQPRWLETDGLTGHSHVQCTDLAIGGETDDVEPESYASVPE